MFRVLGVGLALVIGMLWAGDALAGLCLNEIMADPASDWDGDGTYHFRDDEWVELYNDGPDAVDLGDFGLSNDGGLWTYGFEAGDILGSGEARVIFGSQSVVWQAAHGHHQYGFRMSNDGDTVLLWEFAAGDTLLVDSYSFNTYEADDDRSTGRNPDGIGEWEIFDALNPYSGGTPPPGNGLPPSPGWPNAGEPPVRLDACTWGSVKGLFHE
jgi:hypothetical protein